MGGWGEQGAGDPTPPGAQHAANTWMSYTGLEEGMAANCRQSNFFDDRDQKDGKQERAEAEGEVKVKRRTEYEGQRVESEAVEEEYISRRKRDEDVEKGKLGAERQMGDF